MSRKHLFAILTASAAGAAGVAIGVSAAVTHGTSSPTTKEQYAQAIESQRASDLAHHTPAPKMPPTPQLGAVSGPAQRQAGILNIHQGPVATSVFLSENLWQGPFTGDVWYLVYAGQSVNPDGTKGVPTVIVQTTTPTTDGSLTIQTVGTFADQAADGTLMISSASGAVLTLSTPSGQTVTFNLETHQFQ